MSYPNAYLRDFVPVLGQILKEKQIAPETILRFTQTVRRIFRHLQNKSMRKTV